MGLMRNGVRIRLLAAVAISAMAIATPARAQNGQRQDYNVEAGNLGDALRAVSRLSGREIIFSAEAVNGKHAPRLRGTYSADEAVRALLEGSDLTAEFRKDVILIRGRSETPGEVGDRSAEQADILVTGSRIRGGRSASPIVAKSRETIVKEGQTDLGSYFRSLTQNFSGGQNPGVVGSQGQSENTNGSSALNLRGLGPDATLTLVNGHRSAYDAVAQGVDISAIPLAAVERVEVVTDGASALYGSDAVGGVANVILRHDYQGIETSARLGAATDGGDVEQQYTLLAGQRWGSGGAVATFEYNHASPILAGQRSYTQALDRQATLFSGQKQFSAVIAGHQEISDWLNFEVDGQYNQRSSHVCSAALATSSCTINGSAIDRDVRSFAVSPSLTANLPSGWQVKLSGTHAESDTDVHTSSFTRGATTATFHPQYNNQLDSVELGVEGALFRAPAGDARLAFGGGYRSTRQDTDYRQTAGGVTTPVWVYNQKRETFFAYGELSLPLIGDSQEIPFIRELLLTGAVRYEDNSGFGDLVTPKLGIVFRPTADVAIRGSWGKSFKAPTLFQTGRGLQGYVVPGSIFVPPAPGGGAAIFLLGGRAGLAPEKAETWTSTVTYTPSFAPGLTIQASYFNVRYRDRVVTPITNLAAALGPDYRTFVTLYPSVQDVLGTAANVPEGLINQTGAPFDPSSVVVIVDNALVNAARQKIEGVDFSIGYIGRISAKDAIDFNASASYLKTTQQLIEGRPFQDLAGTVFNPPHWRARAAAGWERDSFRLGATVTYIGGTKDNRFAPIVDINNFTSFDINSRIRTAGDEGLLSRITFELSVLNLFNEKPAVIRTTSAAAIPFDSTNYSSIGRSVSLTVRKEW
jgi:iron complex outermembrane receptor protein